MGITTFPLVTGLPITPNYQRVMIFVDGTNLLIEMGKYLGNRFDPHKAPKSAFALARAAIDTVVHRSNADVILRRYWFGSYYGSDQVRRDQLSALHSLFIQPRLLNKRKHGDEKGVDLALGIAVLTNAFQRNFDVAWLVSGDADYVDLVDEAKRYGGVVNGTFLSRSLAEPLRTAVDEFHALESVIDSLKDHISALQKDVPTASNPIPHKPQVRKAKRP